MSAIERIHESIERGAKGSVELPVMPSIATIKSVTGTKATIKYRSGEDKKVPILQPNYKFEGTDSEGETITMSMKLNLKKGDKVFIAYPEGNYKSPHIIGKVP